MTGKFFWYDIMTTDVAAAASFYTRVLGWRIKASAAPGMFYTVFTLDGQRVAGLMEIPDEVRNDGFLPSWMSYISTDDVDAGAEDIERQGGMVLRPPETIADVFRFAVVADPQGAIFHLAESLSSTPLPSFAPGTEGTVGWRELQATEGHAAFEFYGKTFGWTKAESFDIGPIGTYQLFATGAEPVGGMMTKPYTVPRPYWGLYFNVAAIDAAAERVEQAGGAVIVAPHPVPGPMWVVQCTDPQGASFGLVAPKR